MWYLQFRLQFLKLSSKLSIKGFQDTLRQLLLCNLLLVKFGQGFSVKWVLRYLLRISNKGPKKLIVMHLGITNEVHQDSLSLFIQAFSGIKTIVGWIFHSNKDLVLKFQMIIRSFQFILQILQPHKTQVRMFSIYSSTISKRFMPLIHYQFFLQIMLLPKSFSNFCQEECLSKIQDFLKVLYNLCYVPWLW